LYLKRIEMVGFKSFADRTRLEFEPGMTAIVGPNGCGKSNISDAVRWVLGEQSAKALRGGKMQDVIFNGTQSQKPMGMAEVSLTMTDCEGILGTEFNEVTVTRRVLRSGEGQYYINKAPCRLKDIQRLFMDTGIGTNAYSLMEQGRIDRILSSRPEDRRAVFEEASGITKYKADKKEAIRKLEHTEANLLRLADIIKEVKRQIISLQRQAGKARRYKGLQTKLRSLDVYLTRERLQELDQAIQQGEKKHTIVAEKEEALREDIRGTEALATQIRQELEQLEQDIAAAMDQASDKRSHLERTEQSIHFNTERIEELRSLSERDSRDAEESKAALERHRQKLTDLQSEVQKAQEAKTASEQALAAETEKLNDADQALEKIRAQIEELQNEAVDQENRHVHLQNELSELESRERGTVIRRERLYAEQTDLKQKVEVNERREQEMQGKLASLQADVAQQEADLQQLTDQQRQQHAEIEDIRQRMREREHQLAARQAQVDMLEQRNREEDPYPAGARLLMNAPDELGLEDGCILGPLAERIEAEPAYRTALEAAMRSWLDAVVVHSDQSLRDLLDLLQQQDAGAVRMIALETTLPVEEPMSEGVGEPLLQHVTFPEHLKPLAARMLHGVRVVSALREIPHPVLPGMTYITLDGAVLRADGTAERWRPESGESNPLTRRHLIEERRQECKKLQHEITLHRDTIEKMSNEGMSIEQCLHDARQALEEIRHTRGICEGETQMVRNDAGQAREKLETIEWELKSLNEQQDTGADRKSEISRELNSVRNRQAEIRAGIQQQRENQRTREQGRTEILSAVTDCRVEDAECRQQVKHLLNRQEPLREQISGLETLIRERSEGLDSYHQKITELEKAIETAQGQLAPLREEIQSKEQDLEALRKQRAARNNRLHQSATELNGKRRQLDDVQGQKTNLEIKLAEQRLTRKNITERIAEEYRLGVENLSDEPDPEWENGEIPDRETLETTIAELRTKLNSMGPVNLVAIEEHQELEERYHFLTQQQDDLIKAKQQLMEMIRKINSTTTEMFSQTFDQVNENFQQMFKRLFGGGSAKLVLVNEEDVLESGIEIIARPPGKKLQTVSLLSGGERTLTAVALLFSLYLVKPSPFCMLDELDAALDDTNIGRFVTTVQSFLERSQFIVITHNRQTIGAADVLYGVTMERHGISKIVSVRFADHLKGYKKDEAEEGSLAESLR
jgi:chromosome segregation protein